MVVYRATNKINGEMYVGQTTKTLKQRKNWHKNDATSGRNGCPKFHNGINKYGFENFIFEEIATAQDTDTLRDLEIYYIEWFNTKHPYGYNLTDGGEGSSGHSPSIETRKKMSKASTGRKHTEKSKKAISEGHKGKVFSPETLVKMSEAAKNLWASGVRDTKEYRQKLKGRKSKNPKKGMRILCNETGIEFPSVMQAARIMGLPRPSVWCVLHGKMKQCKGYTFSKVEKRSGESNDV